MSGSLGKQCPFTPGMNCGSNCGLWVDIEGWHGCAIVSMAFDMAELRGRLAK